MQIIKRIVIKQVITEKSKQLLQEKFTQRNTQLERECQQLLFEKRKLTNKLGSAKQIHERFQQEISARKEKIKMNDFKLEQLDLLELGSEIVENEVDALIDVKIGDEWDKIIGKQSIVIEDNIIKRIDDE